MWPKIAMIFRFRIRLNKTGKLVISKGCTGEKNQKEKKLDRKNEKRLNWAKMEKLDMIENNFVKIAFEIEEIQTNLQQIWTIFKQI